ncbi:MAG: GNAT family N-acetyltransferase [Chitinophagaceae bacterium]|nr:MAG: GNAT family N-acetyltransferase [Chitinophagaceae bacterium]
MKEINLKNYERKLILRNTKEEDFDQILEMQKVCFPGMDPWIKSNLENQMKIFPEGQFVIESEGKIVASSSCLIIDNEQYGMDHTWEEISDDGNISNHNEDGDILYGIELMVHPDFRGMKLSSRIYEARKELVRDLNLRLIRIGGRLPGYNNYKDKMKIREYVDKVTSKLIFDPVLTPQLSNGFSLKRIIPKYLEDDLDSGGYATVLEWSNFEYRRDEGKKYLASQPVRICIVQYQMRPVNNFDEFSHQCEYFVDVASGYRSDFIVFPEIFTLQLLSFLPKERPGLAARRLATFTPQYLELFSNLAIRYNINIVGGSHFTEEDEKLYNIAYFFKRNGEICKQYKLHITPNERKWWGVSEGNKVEVFDTDRGKIAIQICYDVEFPELTRIAVEKGARIIFVPFCTDDRQGYLRVRYCAQARCIENQIFVGIAGTVGNLPQVENMDIQYAESGIFTPSDFMFARDAIAGICTPNVETVIINELDLEMLRRNRLRGTVTNWNDRRRDLYKVIYKGE